VKLSDAYVRNVKPTDRRVEIADAVLPGMYLLVQPSGARSWAVRYRHQGRPRKYTIGTYPTIGLATARELAREALEQVARGVDPAAAKAKAGGRSFRAIVDQYIDRYARVRQKTWREAERMLRVEAVSVWGDRPLGEITRDDINQRLYAILDRGSPSTSNHAFAHLRAFFGWAVDEGYIKHSPCERIRRKAPQTPRDRTLTDDEIRVCWQAWTSQGWPGGEFQKLLLATGQRRGEVAGARWDEIDLAERLWVIPRERMKSGRAHAVPLSSMAMEIVDRLPRTGAFLFPGRSGGVEVPISSFGQIKHRADDLIREGGRELARWTFHDLRRSCRSNMSRLRIPSEVAEAVLAHVIPGVRGIYDRHHYLREKTEALEQWAVLLRSIIDPDSDRKVVPLRR
jgi:integrase